VLCYRASKNYTEALETVSVEEAREASLRSLIFLNTSSDEDFLQAFFATSLLGTLT